MGNFPAVEFSNPIIGGWITAFVRCLISELINNVQILGRV
jgi:hypothetical protein